MPPPGSPSDRSSRLTRAQLGGVVLAVFAGVATVAGALRDPDVPLLLQVRWGDRPLWIQAPTDVRRAPHVFGAFPVPQVDFWLRFALPLADDDGVLLLRAWRDVDVWIDGEPVTESLQEIGLRTEGVRLTLPRLAAGSHDLRVRVRNPRGPPLLAARLEASGRRIITDSSWRADVGGHTGLGAILADDTRPLAGSLGLPTPAAGLAEHGPVLIGAAVLGAVVGIALRRLARRRPRVLPWLAAVAVSGLWVAVWLRTGARLPITLGPDAAQHLQYVLAILAEGALPAPTDGWSTYHPPLFYALSAVVFGAGEWAADATAGRLLLRVVPALACLALTFVAGRLARRLHPDRPDLEALTIVGTAVLPLSLLLSQFFSNEPLHGLLASVALLVAVGTLREERLRVRSVVALGLLLGLAVLTKVTTLGLVPWIGLVLLLRLLWVEGASWPRVAGLAALYLGTVAAVCGWFFVRNHRLAGAWLLWNFELPDGSGFWQQPGFHTPDYYLTFGTVLTHPYAAGMRSFWDGLYSTFWGDGMASGLTQVSGLAEVWDLPAMSACYALGVPGTLLIFLGAGRLALDAVRGPDLERRLMITLLLGVVALLGFALLRLTITVPYYSGLKASYVLPALAPLGLCLAVGVSTACGWLRSHRLGALCVLVHGWLAAMAAAVGLAVLR